MQLHSLKESSYSFRIKSTDPNKPPVSIECRASSEASYNEWLDTLNKIVKQQNDLILKLINPLSKWNTNIHTTATTNTRSVEFQKKTKLI